MDDHIRLYPENLIPKSQLKNFYIFLHTILPIYNFSSKLKTPKRKKKNHKYGSKSDHERCEK